MKFNDACLCMSINRFYVCFLGGIGVHFFNEMHNPEIVIFFILFLCIIYSSNICIAVIDAM